MGHHQMGGYLSIDKQLEWMLSQAKCSYSWNLDRPSLIVYIRYVSVQKILFTTVKTNISDGLVISDGCVGDRRR
jgi:hypothetical protein